MRQKVTNIEQVTDSLRPFLEQYLQDNGINTNTNFPCINPKHDDTNASMSIKGKTNRHVANCFGQCGCSADIFTAAHFLEGKSIKGPGFIEENVKYLANKYGVKMDFEDPTPEEIYEYRTYDAYRFASKLISDRNFGDYSLVDEEIERRGWDKDKCAEWGIGTVDYNDYKSRMKAAGYEVNFLNGVDLASSLFNNHNLLFTVYDDFGRPVGFSAKNLKYDKTDPQSKKYINTRGTGLECAIFKKGERLYGFDIAKKANSPLYIFEGQADVITGRHFGIMNSCCTMGTAFTDHHINLLKRHGIFNIVLVFDADKAGEEAAIKALDNRFSANKEFRVKIIQLPCGLDPDELLRTKGIDEWVRQKKWSAFEWRMMKFIDEAGEDLEEDEDKKVEITEQMSKIIVSEKSYIKQEHMAKQVAKMTGCEVSTIMAEVKRLRNEKEGQVTEKKLAAVQSLLSNIHKNPDDLDLALAECQTIVSDINKEAVDKSNSKSNIDFVLSQKEEDEKKPPGFAGLKMDPEGLGNIAARLDEAWDSGRLFYVGGGEQSAKCVKYDTPIQLPTGESKTIEEVCKLKLSTVLGMDNNHKIVPMNVSNWINSGKLECYKVQTSNGLFTEVSEIHPYYTLDGWKKVTDLKVGDNIAIVKNYNCYNNLHSPIKEEEAILLGTFLSEGSLTQGPVFSNMDQEFIDRTFNAANKLWPGLTISSKSNNQKDWYIKDPIDPKVNRLTNWLRKYNIWNKTSHEKIIPNEIFQCGLKRVGTFLGMFWAGDGWVSYKKEQNKFEIGITLCNYTMIKQIRSLLLRFGIKTKILYQVAKYEREGKEFPCYTLSIGDIKNAKKFYNNIRIPLKRKQDSLKLIMESNKSILGAYSDNLPSELWDYIDKKCKEKGKTLSWLRKTINHDNITLDYDKTKDRYKETSNFKKKKLNNNNFTGITEAKIKLMGYILNDQFLISLSEGDIYFDKITSINSIGKHQCYDLTIPQYHNFIANDTIVHNTSLLSQMAYEIVTNNDNVICVYHSIDDAAKLILYKWVCRAHNELKLQLNHIASPNYWSSQDGLGWIPQERDIAYQRIIKLMEEQKLILADASDGVSFMYPLSLIRQLREKYPSKKILLFCDNFHKYPDFADLGEAGKTKKLSNVMKTTVVAENITIISSVEYKKMEPGQKPSNYFISQSKSLQYDADVIMHCYNDVYMNGAENAVLRHEYNNEIYPRIWVKFGKNKVSGYIDREFLDLHPFHATLRSVDKDIALQEQRERIAFLKENESKDW